jgi:phenol 2-monooxygenase
MLGLLLSRYGIQDDRLLCLDAKDGSVKAGQADGLQPRTIEVFESLGLADEIVNDACHMWEVAFWNPEAKGIARTSTVPDIGAPARYAQEFTIHQGRIERILTDDFARYSERGVMYNSEVHSVLVDGDSNSEYPVTVTVKNGSNGRLDSYNTIRAKHVIGCDGARSKVRSSVNLQLEGDTRDHIWGVIDLVTETDFPDIRRRCAIHSNAGSVMIIPRERIPSGEYLTRLYIQMNDEVDTEHGNSTPAASGGKYSEAALDAREQARQKRAKITLDSLLQQAKAAFAPYKIAVKEGTEVDWWAAYQIGQRMADSFCVRDKSGIPRVFIAGDGKTFDIHSDHSYYPCALTDLYLF